MYRSEPHHLLHAAPDRHTVLDVAYVECIVKETHYSHVIFSKYIYKVIDVMTTGALALSLTSPTINSMYTRHTQVGHWAHCCHVSASETSPDADADGHIGYLYFPSFVIFSVKFPHVATRSATFYTSICTTVPSTRVRATATRRKLEQAHDISHVLFVRIGSACIV